MKNEDPLELAADALAKSDQSAASIFYEEAARESRPANLDQAAHLLLLAARYAEPDMARADRLALEAQRIYESKGDYEQLAATLLLRAHRAETMTEYGEAEDLYVKCLQTSALRLSSLVAHDTSPEQRSSLLVNLNPPIDRLNYCRDRLQQLIDGEVPDGN